MLTQKKFLTKKLSSVRFIKMIEFKLVKKIYNNKCNNMIKLPLFEKFNAKALSGSYYLKGE